MDAPERIWACAGKRGGNRYWAKGDECYIASHEVGAYVRADLHDAALAKVERLRAEVERLRYQINEATDPYFIFGAMDNVNDMDVSLDDFAQAASRAQRAALAPASGAGGGEAGE